MSQPGKGFLVWLAGLSVLGFLATDMYLPAFAAMQQDLDTSAASISASLSLFLAGFALGQLFWGPLSDRYGRKPVLLSGLAISRSLPGDAVGAERHSDAGAALSAGDWRLRRGGHLAGDGDRLLSRPAHQPHLRHHYAAGRLSPALAPLLGSWLLVHFEWQAIFATLFAITLLLMLPALRLKAAAKSATVTEKKITFLALLRSREYSGNVLIYAACSASFFAWLTGSPFILHEMGYGPTAIGLSYIPQTIAFLVGGYGCRALLQKWSGQQMLPWLLVIFAVSVAATWLVGLQTHASLVALMIPFCLMAVVNGGIYPIVVAQALKPFPQATGRAAALQNTLQLGLCFLTSLLVSALIATPLLTTTSVMLVSILLAGVGYRLQQTPELAVHSSHA